MISNRHGFSIVELAYVLVAIGLITGGIIAAKDLIRASEVRNGASQIQEYQTAFTYFQAKYNALPGDLPPALATKYGFATRTGGAGDGDDNGFIQAYFFANDNNYMWFGGENIFFWADLANAKLISGNFTGVGASSFISENTVAGHNALWPQSRLGPNLYVTVYSYQGKHYLDIMGIGRVFNGLVVNGPLYGEKYSPVKAFAVDTKFDDGLPTSGNIRASVGTFPKNLVGSPAQPSANGICAMNDGSGDQYNLVDAYANRTLCAQQFLLQ